MSARARRRSPRIQVVWAPFRPLLLRPRRRVRALRLWLLLICQVRQGFRAQAVARHAVSNRSRDNTPLVPVTYPSYNSRLHILVRLPRYTSWLQIPGGTNEKDSGCRAPAKLRHAATPSYSGAWPQTLLTTGITKGRRPVSSKARCASELSRDSATPRWPPPVSTTLLISSLSRSSRSPDSAS